MPRSLERNNGLGIEQYPLRPQDHILRALAKGVAEYQRTVGRKPKTFFLTQTAYDDLESKFPQNHRGTRRIFYGMTMKVNDNLGLGDDEYEMAD